jgi:hypothetical protein
VGHVATGSKASNPLPTDTDSFLLQYIRSNPGVRFGALSRATQLACHVSRATATRRIARLVRFGEVTLLPDRTYVAGGSTTPPSRAVMEIHWTDDAVVIRPDGSSRDFVRREFRVVSGQLDHILINHPGPVRQFIYWSTTAGRMKWVPASRTPSRQGKHLFSFAAPLTARTTTWQRMSWTTEFPKLYRMAYTPKSGAPRSGAEGETARESEAVEFETESRRFEHRFSPEAHLRLQIVFPEDYPIGPARCRVRFGTEPNRFDVIEERRLAKLSGDRWRLDGMRRSGTTLTLSVPQPLLDREYEIEWALPTTTERVRWLTAQRRRLDSLLVRSAPRRANRSRRTNPRISVSSPTRGRARAVERHR